MLLLGTPICLRGPPSWSADAISLSLLEKISLEPVRTSPLMGEHDVLEGPIGCEENFPEPNPKYF